MEYSLLLFVVAEIYSVESGLAPDIFLKGNSFTQNNSTLFQLTCSTNIAVWQCSVEFLIEKRTHNDIRYADNKCYHTYGICPPNMCACSKSCKSFTWNVTVIEDMKNHSYSCVTRMVTGEVTFLANITVNWDDKNGFQTLKKIVVPTNIVTQQSTTPKSESVQLIIISTTVGSLTCILTLVGLTLTCRKKCRSKKNGKAPQCIMNENPIYQIPDHRNCIETNVSRPVPSNSFISMNTPARQDDRNAKLTGDIHVQRPTPDLRDSRNSPSNYHKENCKQNVILKGVPGKENEHMMFYVVRPGKTNSNSKTKKSSIPVRYSSLPGERNSTSTQSSTSEEGTQSVSNNINIKVDSRIVLRSKSLRESNA